MFTWNFLYISKSKLAETFHQLKIDSMKGDILIRIHTAIHRGDEACDLARFIKSLAPAAKIFGTSTSAVINKGHLVKDQCVVSVTQMAEASVNTFVIPVFNSDGTPRSPRELCSEVAATAVDIDTRLMITFLTAKYRNVYEFVDLCNDYAPGIQMIGGLANTPDVSLREFIDSGFVFDETGWYDNAMLIASFGGGSFESFTSCATGIQPVGDEFEITDTFGPCILGFDGNDAPSAFRNGIGEVLRNDPELTAIFPYVYSDTSSIPILMHWTDQKSLQEAFPVEDPANRAAYDKHPGIDRDMKRELLIANHDVLPGKIVRRAFIYDRKLISDNRELFRRIENFKKCETIFGYSCIARSVIYSNCVNWELSAYENSNICGCITEGEITHVNGRNTFANCSFVVSVAGENEYAQELNSYVFSKTNKLSEDNRRLLDYIMNQERLMESGKTDAGRSLRDFVKECEQKLLMSGKENIPNASAMNIDIGTKGYDRICLIDVIDTAGMDVVFSDTIIELTNNNFINKCITYADKKRYHIYRLDRWRVAIAEPSYKVSLRKFISDMEILQKELFRYSNGCIATIPVFCVIDGCTTENLDRMYYTSRVEMNKKNIQFFVCDATSEDRLDEESIRERYHIVNVINYALSNNKIIPYYQGIYDNKTGKIHHYESLMRLEDENGKVYYPGSFLDVARSFGVLYDSLSKFMITKVFEKFRNTEHICVSINIGIRDIKNSEISELIFDNLSRVPHPGNFIFEILENEDIDDYREMIEFVDRIHSLGGKISIDDFGSGFSNLQHIANIHSDFLKIDGSIVRTCPVNPESEKLIALITGWKSLSTKKIHIIAEFVENEQIQEILTRYGVDFSQGYLFSKPSPDIEGF